MVDRKTDEALDAIVSVHQWMMKHWDDGLPGWAPRKATLLLERNRLDRLLELARALRTWKNPHLQCDGHLTLAWANLGALVEGSMKWLLCVYAASYSRDPVSRSGKPLDPDKLSFEAIRQYFRANVWGPRIEGDRDAFVGRVQRKRNAIHAYDGHDIGDFHEFWDHVREYSVWLEDLVTRAPELPGGTSWY